MVTPRVWHTYVGTYHSLGELVKIPHKNLFDHFRVNSDKERCPSHEDTTKEHSRKE